MADDPSNKDSKRSLAAQVEKSIISRPDADPLPISTAAPIERYYARCLEQAWSNFRMKLRQEATLGGITAVGVLLLTVVLFLFRIVPWLSLMPCMVFVAVFLSYFAYVLFRAPANLDKERQLEISELKHAIEELRTECASELAATRNQLQSEYESKLGALATDRDSLKAELEKRNNQLRDDADRDAAIIQLARLVEEGYEYYLQSYASPTTAPVEKISDWGNRAEQILSEYLYDVYKLEFHTCPRQLPDGIPSEWKYEGSGSSCGYLYPRIELLKSYMKAISELRLFPKRRLDA